MLKVSTESVQKRENQLELKLLSESFSKVLKHVKKAGKCNPDLVVINVKSDFRYSQMSSKFDPNYS